MNFVEWYDVKGGPGFKRIKMALKAKGFPKYP